MWLSGYGGPGGILVYFGVPSSADQIQINNSLPCETNKLYCKISLTSV